ncbi:MAG: hypothetical protein WC611_05480 [Candidatus Neomarinimicrobiota bacterium]|jgi:hypothetical protein|nr:hypothetical protein [Candidatus Neomarinimicrobiota bacterium]
MRELTKKEIIRQDFVDNAIFDFIKELNLSSKTIDWNIEMIGEIRDIVSDWIVNKLKICTEQEFYPYINSNE